MPSDRRHNQRRCSQCACAYRLQHDRQVRHEALVHYSLPHNAEHDIAACIDCGEMREDVLTLEHTQGDGAEQRRQMSGMAGAQLATWLRKRNWPEGFGTLCWNDQNLRRLSDPKQHGGGSNTRGKNLKHSAAWLAEREP